jgi:hypothetical protein
MFESVRKRSALRVFLIIALLLSAVIVASFAAYALQSVSIPLEVKEPLEIIEYPSGLSLYPGENVTFEITVQNSASVTYFVEFDFRLNDTKYQARYVTFSNYNYSIVPGTQKLTAWLTIASTAPPANLILTIDRKTDAQFPSPSPAPSPTPFPTTSLAPSLMLLGGGARWAARNGTSALYVNWEDNWAAHHLTDGADWSWFSESGMENWRSSITNALQQSGFEVTLAGDIPDNLDDYDLVVLFAYYAAEPRLEPLIRDYVSNGGSVVILAATQCYFTVYSKSLSLYSPVSYESGNNYASIQEWFGCSDYFNTGGSAYPAFDNPFGTSLSKSDVLFTGVPTHAGVSALSEDAEAIAFWSSGAVFAFTHEYGYGRVYYQAIVEQI